MRKWIPISPRIRCVTPPPVRTQHVVVGRAAADEGDPPVALHLADARERAAAGIARDLREGLALRIVGEDLADAGIRSVAGEVRRALECQQAAVVAERGIAALPESGGQ